MKKKISIKPSLKFYVKSPLDAAKWYIKEIGIKPFHIDAQKAIFSLNGMVLMLLKINS